VVIGKIPMRIYPGFLLLTALLACGSMACGPDHQGLCEEAEKCRGGNEADIDACVADADYEEDVADIQGCTDEYNTYMDCFIQEAQCDSASKSYGLRNDNCEAESNAYQRCRG